MNNLRFVGLVRLVGFSLIALIAAISLNGIGCANAKEVILDGPVQNVVTRLDKNGNEYTRVIVTVERELNGNKYTTGVPLMAFGIEQSATVKNLQKGDSIKAIARYNEYKGRESYSLIKKLK
jgi:hypothetical protein